MSTNELNTRIEKAFKDAAYESIPKSKENFNRNNYPSYITKVLGLRNQAAKAFKINRNEFNANKHKELEL